MVAEAGEIDVLIANLGCTIDPYVPAEQMSDEGWHHMFDIMVHPLHGMCRTVLPQMYARKKGKIVVFGSASGIKWVKGVSAYSAARTAQIGYVRSVAGEAAPHNVQVNLIAQHFTRNPSYFPDDFVDSELCKQWLKDCPAGRLATGEEDALLALFLASNESDFITGAAIPFTGGWHL
jgi:2-keto-3-deoxy-L-fuconate dehydrogenase